MGSPLRGSGWWLAPLRAAVRGALRLLCAACALAGLLAAGAAWAEPRPGRPVPPFATQLIDGTRLPAAALERKVVLVVFWATWCPACQKELPELQKLYARHRSRGLEILALSVDADRFTVEAFREDHEYTFPMAMRTAEHERVFGRVKATPTLYLIDRAGVLRAARTGALGEARLEALLRPLL